MAAMFVSTMPETVDTLVVMRALMFVTGVPRLPAVNAMRRNRSSMMKLAIISRLGPGIYMADVIG